MNKQHIIGHSWPNELCPAYQLKKMLGKLGGNEDPKSKRTNMSRILRKQTIFPLRNCLTPGVRFHAQIRKGEDFEEGSQRKMSRVSTRELK
ncbi:hypothetical protein KIN20_000890 [Parelaphostrongylus tenuis]|uniref:Uncharacterized protein n=1 Tax=Parelaphostrongylus tenuis TaxID=148309 RepID=A0AAD5LT88_PARTN|nr:hypothetical protein KIN20_000890 [Parelaphostrongylus tenuis]